jgi:hypothetical protein
MQCIDGVSAIAGAGIVFIGASQGVCVGGLNQSIDTRAGGSLFKKSIDAIHCRRHFQYRIYLYLHGSYYHKTGHYSTLETWSLMTTGKSRVFRRFTRSQEK